MDLNNINLTSLYYFKIVAEQENMTKAAENLFISQPALSKAILKLEKNLGVALFERSKGRIHLSSAGTDFYQYVQAAFDDIEAGFARLDQLKMEYDDRVRIASPVSDLLNSMVFEFMSRVPPSTHVDQFLFFPTQLEERLLAGDVDIAITPITMESSDVNYVKCMEEEIVAVVNQKHRLAARGAVCLWELRNDPFLVNESSFDKKIICVHCKLVGFTPNITFHCNEDSAINQALHRNMGVALMPGNVIYRNRMNQDGLVPLRLTDVEIIRMLGIATKKGSILSSNGQKLFNFARRYYEQMGLDIAAYLDSILPPISTSSRKTLGIQNIRPNNRPIRPQ